ncbi:transposase [Oxynema sp. CENA135]|uniref:transposase n=1 Tax=Oxynema sp. CENA135 TaxID=984206 RepID=UPI001F216499|nr:transposase [Oxynema sp. CENA135]
MLTQWKQEEALQLLTEVSAVALQQRLRHLEKGYSNFVAGRAKYPHFKIHEQIKDARSDCLHKLTTRLVRENQTLVVESPLIPLNKGGTKE